MRQYTLQLIAAFALVMAFVLLLGWAGDIDITDQVILSMSQEQYDFVKDSLTKQNGRQPSQSEIAHWWADHHK